MLSELPFMSQLHAFLRWRCFFEIFYWLQFSPCAFMAHNFCVWYDGSRWGMSCCKVIKHMEREPPFSLHMCPGRARALGGDSRQWPPSCICTEPQSPPGFSNGHQIHQRTWASECPVSTQVKVLPSLTLTHLDFPVFSLGMWPCCHPRKNHGGFLCVQLGASWSARTATY